MNKNFEFNSDTTLQHVTRGCPVIINQELVLPIEANGGYVFCIPLKLLHAYKYDTVVHFPSKAEIESEVNNAT